MSEAKPFKIPKRLVWDAYQQVRANRGAGGVDGVSLAAFEKDLKGNLYKVWNRMSSGSYHPAAGAARRDSQRRGRHAASRHSDDRRSRGANGREDGPGAGGGTGVSP